MSHAGSLVWRREGLLLGVKAGHGWWKSHVQLPTILSISDRLWRIYFCARNDENRSHIIAVDVDPGAGMRIVAEHFEPLLALGAPGEFDHEGMGVSSVLRVDGQVYLFYTGVAIRRDVPAQTAIGLAISDDGLNFRRPFAGPVRSTGPLDPLSVLAAHVRPQPGGFRMWYVSGTAWRLIGGKLDMFYEIRTGASVDAAFWDSRTLAVISLRDGTDGGLGRPYVLDTNQGMHMWYCRRGVNFRQAGKDAYHLVSVALDADGLAAGATEPVVFENPPQPADFDSWTQSYSCILPHGEDLIMVYNGDNFGAIGFGWATCRGGAVGL